MCAPMPPKNSRQTRKKDWDESTHRRRKKEPHVGIFWVVNAKPIIDSTLLSKAETYDDFLIHAGGHDKVWERYQQSGLVPADMEYEESPRGRVMFNTKTRRFTLLADRCILKRKDLVGRIMSEMKLPENTATDTDSHYRCGICLHSG
jgi:hypothetical protein